MTAEHPRYEGGVSPQGSSQEAIIRAIAGHGLPSSAWRLGDDPLPTPLWTEVLAQAKQGRLLGLMGEAVAMRTLPVTGPQLEQLRSSHLDAQARSVLLERMALRLVGLLARQGVPMALMGGLASAHSDYVDPSLRPVDELCFLVDTSDLPTALQLLGDEGWRRMRPEPAAGFDQRFGMGVRMRDGASIPLDLIRTLAPPPYSLAIPAEATWDHLQSVEVGGTKVKIPGPALRLLHACADLVASEPDGRLIRARDAAQAIYGIEEPVAVVELALSWQLGALIAWAVRRVWEVLQLEESLWLTAWAECYEPAGWERRALARVTDPRSGYAARALTGMPMVPGIGNKLAFARVIMLPDRSYRRGRRRQRLGRFVRLMRRPRSTGSRI
jgi:hypothetical protein